MSTNKEKFINALSRTGREGIDKVLRRLEDSGFYEAPASTKFHLSRKGGLLEHSLNVYEAALGLWEQAIRIRPDIEEALPLDSVAICSAVVLISTASSGVTVCWAGMP